MAILHEMIINEIKKNNLKLNGVNPQLLVIHPDRLRKILSEHAVLNKVAEEKQDELETAAVKARQERQGKEQEATRIAAEKKAEARKQRLAEIALENEEKETQLALERKEIEQRKEKLRADKTAAASASGLAKEIPSKVQAQPAPKKAAPKAGRKRNK